MPVKRAKARAWTTAKITRLKDMHRRGLKLREIGSALNRDEGSVSQAARKAGLLRCLGRWSEDEDEELKRMIGEGLTYAVIALELGRPHGACRQRASIKGWTRTAQKSDR